MRPTEEIPRSIGRYTIEGVLGRGGMATVYAGRSPTGEAVAIKILHPHRTSEEATVRFALEGRLSLAHPNIVRVVETGEDERAEPFIAFERLEGESLADRLVRGSLSAEEVRKIGIDVASGLAVAHAAGLVHRDLKPSNLFLCATGPTKILDFGVALERRAQRRVTLSSGKLLGTLQYTSPEQAQGARDLDSRSDIWSLGVVLFEALTGVRPFAREGQVATVLAIVLDSPPSLAVLAPQAPRPLTLAIERCLLKAREHRTASADALKAELEAVVFDRPSAPASIVRAGATGARKKEVVARPIAQAERRIVASVVAEGVVDGSALSTRARHESGTYVPMLGDRAIVLFGTHTWEGDELVRAVRYAIEAHPLAARLSVAAGLTVRRGAHVEGEAITRAERNLGQTAGGVPEAPDNGVVVDWQIAASLDGLETRPYGPEAELVLARVAEIAPARSNTPLVGRDPELAQLAAAARVARDDRYGVLVRIRGGIGSGKTRLVSAAVAALASQGAVVTTDIDAASDAILRTGDAILTVLVVDDAHRLSPSQVERLESLLEEDLPFLAILTLREDASGERFDALRGRETSDVQLRGLSVSEVRAFVANLIGEDVDPSFATALRERTDGNPFFVERIVRRVARRGPTSPVERQEAMLAALPLEVAAAVQSRLDRLVASERELCMLASIHLHPFRDRDLEALGCADVERRVSTLVRVGILLSRGPRGQGREHAFRSALTREVAYAMLTPARRAELHRAALDALIRGGEDATDRATSHRALLAEAQAEAER